MSARSKLRAVPGVARALPWVVRARWRLRATPDLREVLKAHDRTPPVAPTPPPSIEALRRGVDGAIRVVGPREAHCVTRGLALFAMLTKAGYPAVFVSGVRRAGPELQGHAWVLVDGEPVETEVARAELANYREQFRFGSGGKGGGGRTLRSRWD